MGLFIRYAWNSQSTGKKREIGEVIDRHNGVAVYYNGPVSNVSGRNLAADGYNLGLKYQCVEFVKRYYYERLQHKMVDSYGHAKDFFSKEVKDGAYNNKRGLKQFTNPSFSKPLPDDLLIYGPTSFNPFGHVAIVATVSDNEVEIVQQNPGPFSSSREKIRLSRKGDFWMLEDHRILGWLRKE
jgi:surface antigen